MANLLDPVTVNVIYFGHTLLEFLKNQLVLVNRCLTSYEGAATAPGNTIQVPYVSIPAAAATRAIGGNAVATNVNAFTASVLMQQIYQAVTLDNLQNLFSSVNLMEETAAQMAYNIAAKADGMVADLHKRIPNTAGKTDGTAAFNTTDLLKPLNDARKVLMANKSPMNDLTCVLNPTEGAGFRSLPNLYKVNEAGSSDLLRRASMGEIMGFQMFESQQIASGVQLNTNAVTLTPGAVTNASGYPVGTTSININGVGAGTIPAGTNFTIASSGTTTRYSVTADAAITTNAATISIYPPLRVAAVDTDVITFAEYTNTTSANLAFNRNAILCVARPTQPFTVNSGVASHIVTDDQTGLSVRIAIESHLLGTPGYTESIAADLVFGTEVVRPESAVKILGAN